MSSERLTEIATLVNALTFGEMTELVSGVWQLRAGREIDECKLARMLHRWTVKTIAGEELVPAVAPEAAVSSIAELPAPAVPAASSAAAAVLAQLDRHPTAESTAPELAPAERVEATMAGAPSVSEFSAPSRYASWGFSIRRLKAITGKTDDELRTLATMNAVEFAEYQRKLAELPVAVATAPAPTAGLVEPTAEAPALALAPVGAARFARTVRELTELQAAE
jgi:hypothetical protein